MTLQTPPAAEDDTPEDPPDPFATPRNAGSTFYAFGSPVYRVLWANCFFLLTMVHMAITAQNVVAYELTGRNSSVGLLAATIGVGVLVTTPIAGAVADRISKRLLLFGSQVLVLIHSATLTVLLLTGVLVYEMMLPLMLLFGIGMSFFWPGITASMADTVDEDKQANGAALFQIALNLTRSFAPFVAGGLLAWDAVGFGGTYVVVTAILAPTLLTLFWLPKAGSGRPRAARAGILNEMRLGLRHVQENRPLKQAMSMFIVIVLLGFSIMVVMPAYAKDVLGAGEAGFGIMFGMNAAGGLVAGLVLASKASSPHIRRYLFATSLGLGISVCLLGLAPSFPVAVAAVMAAGACSGAFQTLIMAAILRATVPEYFGRVMALTNIGWALNNFFGLFLGVTADVTSERFALVGAGVVMAVAAVALAAWARSTPEPSAIGAQAA